MQHAARGLPGAPHRRVFVVRGGCPVTARRTVESTSPRWRVLLPRLIDMVTHLNRGMYDLVEVAHLLTTSTERVVRWSTPTRSRSAIVAPSLDPLFSFHDLISLLVVSKLSHRGVSNEDLSHGVNTLSAELGTDRPLAREEMRDSIATVGRSFFARLHGEWLDVGKGGQRAFPEAVIPDLRQVEYGDDHFAAVWRPLRGVWINPRVQAGAACIEGTRIPTAVIARAVAQGEPPEEVAEDYELNVAEVLGATRFERRLQAA